LTAAHAEYAPRVTVSAHFPDRFLPRELLLPRLTRPTFPCCLAVARAEKACAPDLPTIGELAGSAPDLSTLVAAVKAANLTDVLSLPGPIDVFAPTNDAFGALLSSLNISAETLLAETALLTNVLQYHVVVDGAVCSGDLSGAVETAQGGALTVSGSTVTDANGNAANIVGAINAGNGVVYVIDSVLLPPADDSTAASAPVAEGASAQDVFNALDADGDGLVTEAELRAAAEARGIQLTEEQVAAFLAADADGDGVDLDEYLTSLDTTVLGVSFLSTVNSMYESLTDEQLALLEASGAAAIGSLDDDELALLEDSGAAAIDQSG
jgi:uncharacterized surface protein with fasciclin (FAS1) repeats